MFLTVFYIPIEVRVTRVDISRRNLFRCFNYDIWYYYRGRDTLISQARSTLACTSGDSRTLRNAGALTSVIERHHVTLLDRRVCWSCWDGSLNHGRMIGNQYLLHLDSQANCIHIKYQLKGYYKYKAARPPPLFFFFSFYVMQHTFRWC